MPLWPHWLQIARQHAEEVRTHVGGHDSRELDVAMIGEPPDALVRRSQRPASTGCAMCAS